MTEHRLAGSHATGLYKFRAYDTESHLKHVQDLLKLGHMRFSRPGDFNDPFECRPKMKAKYSDERMRELVRKKMKANTRGEKWLRREQLLRNISKIAIVDAIKDTETKHRLRLAETALYCFSGDRTHPMQWAHYADSHRGVCLQFDHKRVPLAAAIQVTYSDSYPVFSFPSEDDEDDRAMLTESFLKKASWWKYEHEYRLLSVRSGNPAWEIGLTWRSELDAVVDPKLIVGMTLGARMCDSHRAQLLAFRDEFRTDLPVDAAQISDEKFELAFVTIRA